MTYIEKLKKAKSRDPIYTHNINVLVPTTVLEFDLSYIIKNDELLTIIKQHKKEFPVGIKEYDKMRDLRAWHSNWLTHLINLKFDPFIQTIKSCLDSHYPEIEITNFWFTTYEDSGYATKHNHSPAFLSGVYFVECDAKSAPLTLYSGASEETVDIQPKVGKLVVFPGYVYHSVNVSDPETNRTSIAFNFHVSRNKNYITEDQIEKIKKLCRGTDV
jgi:hypothetical protein